MFKIAFPFASHAEEKAERDHLKSLDATSRDEVAGNVWVAPEFGRTGPEVFAAVNADVNNSPRIGI